MKMLRFTRGQKGSKRLIRKVFRGLTGLALALPLSCTQESVLPENPQLVPSATKICILVHHDRYLSKAIHPEEELISNLNLLIFDEEGNLYRQEYLDSRTTSPICWEGSVLEDINYQIAACANFGYRMEGIQTFQDLRSFRYHLAHPDEYKGGIPMVGLFEGPIHEGSPGISTGKNGERILSIGLERMTAKISVSMDRSRLDEGITMNVRSIAIRQCPSSASLFGPSQVRDRQEVFTDGYCKAYEEVDPLNREANAGISDEVSLYMLENCLGDLLPDAQKSSDKILGERPEAPIAPYVEMDLEYLSDEYQSGPGQYLHYRFYLGEGPSNFDIERNCHYHYEVRPTGNGLDEISWRVDKSQLNALKESKIRIMPSEYLEGKVGETLHVWGEMEDPDAQFDIGLEELEYEKERGMFDWQLDEDGRGVSLLLKKQGSAILYMSSGVWSAMAVIVIR